MHKPQIGLFSDFNFLAVNILESLLIKKCFVKIYSSNFNEWGVGTKHLHKDGNFEIVPNSNKYLFEDVDYAIFICGFANMPSIKKEVSKIAGYKFSRATKNILVFPLETHAFLQDYRIISSENLAVVYVSDILGPRMNLSSDLLINRIICSSIYKKTIDLGIGEKFYPINVIDAARTIVGWLFSFGPYGTETVILGEEVSASLFLVELRRYIPNLTVTNNPSIKTRYFPKGLNIRRSPTNIRHLLGETFKWLSSLPKQSNHKPSEPKWLVAHSSMGIDPKIKKNIRSTLIICLLILSPFIFAILSSLFMWSAYKSFMIGNEVKTRNFTYVSKTLAVVGKSESKPLTRVPLIGKVYKEAYFINSTLLDIGDMAESLSGLAQSSSELLGKVMSDQIYDPNLYVERLLPNINYIHQKLAVLEIDVNTQASQGGVTAKKILDKIDISRYKLIASQGKTIISNLPQDLGVYGAKTYLVLFQNNMELRPAGGFIGSYGLLTFEGGRMIDLSVSDVYSADGQLKGHVEPPGPIKKYLNEANWWLRDSNWDPDFSTSAKRAEWFLDKEIDQSVDGVIGVDLESVKKLLEVVGTIRLPDYNMDITSENLYEKTQSEIEREFFPGSTKKASFLTALSRNLISELERLEGREKINAVKAIFQSLEQRHIQVYSHNPNSQKPFSDLAWSGEVKVPICVENCFADLIGTVEANLGVNKSNFFIKRNQALEVKISPDKIVRALAVELTNTANSNLGGSGVYKNYIRLLTNANSKIGRVMIVSGQANDYLEAEISNVKDRKESGIYVEIYPGQTKKIIFSWEDSLPSPISSGGEYRLYVRKQAGISEYPLEIRVRNTNSLTNPEDNVYNTTLARDFFSRISW